MFCDFDAVALGRRLLMRIGGRVVECTGLENRRACKRTVGSNPTLSASIIIAITSSVLYSNFYTQNNRLCMKTKRLQPLP